MPERIILDSSVIIAAALTPNGSTARFLKLVDEADVTVIWSQKLGYELDEKLKGDTTLSRMIKPSTTSALMEWLGYRAELVSDIKLDQPLPLSHDRDDDYLVALARAEKAWLITLDNKLIESGPPEVRIVRPADFIDAIKSSY